MIDENSPTFLAARAEWRESLPLVAEGKDPSFPSPRGRYRERLDNWRSIGEISDLLVRDIHRRREKAGKDATVPVIPLIPGTNSETAANTLTDNGPPKDRR